MKKQLGLALACLWLAAPPVLAQPRLHKSTAPSELAQAQAAREAAATSPLDSSLFYELLLSEISIQDGEPAAGFSLMLDAAHKTGDAQLYQRATDIALQARSGDSALQAVNAWKQALPASHKANRYLLQILITLNRIAETKEPLKTEIRQASTADQVALINAVPQTYDRAGDKRLAATVVESVLADYLKRPATASAAWTSVGRMRAAAGDKAGALQAIERGHSADARAEGPAVVALSLIAPELPGAEALIKNYLKSPAGAARPEIRMAYARTLLGMQRYADASAQLKILTHDKPEVPEGWLILGSLQLQDDLLEPAQASLERYIALALPQAQENGRRGLNQAYLSLSQVAEKRKDYAAAENWLGKIDDTAVLVSAQARRASILASQGKLEEGRQLIRQLPARSDEEARLKLNAEIALLREFKQYQPAYDLLAQALIQTPDDADLLYEQAMIAEKLNLLDEMERMLRRATEIKPDFQHAYNALGYSLADRNTRLPEALELIRKALSYAPTDPFINDSLGWVEFRMGRTAEALKTFETAYQAKKDPEIAAHYGEVLWSLGQRERALLVWKEGQQLSPDNETLRETLKRLQVDL